MAKIAFLLLCHTDPEGVIRQAERLTATGDVVAIHYDARSNTADYRRLLDALETNPRVTFVRHRVKCGWGSWSLVQASLNTLDAAVTAFPQATHFYLLSGDCMPIKSAEYAHAFLDADDADYIESVDFFSGGWIKTGIRDERVIYRHYFNERTHKRLFYAAMDLQRRLGLRRLPPKDLQIMIGSQWWCLRRTSVERLLNFCRTRRDVMRFFSTTWIPDETFFQTIIRHLVPATEIRGRSTTFLIFTDYGLPVTFFNDHYDMLLGQNYLFARKVGHHATELQRRLGEVWASTGNDFPITDDGPRLFRYLTGRGRVGHRFAPRIWETQATLGRDRELLVLVCKKWHVAKRLAGRVGDVAKVPTVDYLFNEQQTDLPDLGGIASTLAKRGRHRRSLLRLLFDQLGTDRLLICVDPADVYLLQDFAADRATVKVLEIACDFTDDFLIGHARRIGLAGEATGPELLDRLLPTIRQDIRFESDRLRDAGLPGVFRIRQGADSAQNAAALAPFLSIPTDAAEDIATTDNLFSD